jgi:hypothetical protein
MKITQSDTSPALSGAYIHHPVFDVEQFSQRHKAFTQPAMRNLIYKASSRLNADGETVPGNGLIEAGAILRIGRKVLIHEQRFFEWLDAQQGGAK